MEWTQAALEAASAELRRTHKWEGTQYLNEVKDALDAAVKAQGLEEQMREDALQHIATQGQALENYARGRAEALEEAAVAFSKLAFEKNESPNLIREYCAAIRALK